MTPSVRSTTVVDLGVGELERHRAAVEVEQPTAGVGVGQVDLDGDVDPTRPGGQRRLEQVGAVGRQDEEEVGVAGGTVHRVEEVEQHRAGPGPEAAVLGDQVDVLEHDDRGLQVARELRHRRRSRAGERPVRTSRV